VNPPVSVPFIISRTLSLHTRDGMDSESQPDGSPSRRRHQCLLMFVICIILHLFLPYKIHFLHNGEVVLAPHVYRVRSGKGVIGLFHEANTWWLRHTLFTDSLRLAAVKGLYPNDFSSITASYEMITMATPALSSRNGKWCVSGHRHRIRFEV
jgi:hypothetical protein